MASKSWVSREKWRRQTLDERLLEPLNTSRKKLHFVYGQLEGFKWSKMSSTQTRIETINFNLEFSEKFYTNFVGKTRSFKQIEIAFFVSWSLFKEKKVVVKLRKISLFQIVLSGSASVPENKPRGTKIGSFTSVDPNSQDQHSYIIVSGGGGKFELRGANLSTLTSFNYESLPNV